MHYTELEVIDQMKFCRKSDANLIFSYLIQMPHWREVVFKRHIRFINAMINTNGAYGPIAKSCGYSAEGIENIFRKIQTCLRLELEYENKNKTMEYNKTHSKVTQFPIVQKVERSTDKDAMLTETFDYIRSIENVESNKVNDYQRKKVLELILENKNVIDIEKSLGISASTIYDIMFTSETDSIFIDLK